MALCVGYPCDAKSEIGDGLLSAGLQGESSTCNPIRYKLLAQCRFILQVGSHRRGNFNLRESVPNSSSPEPCHVLSINPFCSFLKKVIGKPCIGEEKSRRVTVYLLAVAMASSALGWLQVLCWQPGKWSPARKHDKGKGFWQYHPQALSSHGETVTPGKARSGSLPGGGAGVMHGSWRSADDSKSEQGGQCICYTQKKSIHCTYVSCTESVMQLQPPRAACSYTEIIQPHLEQPPSHLVRIFPFPSPILSCLHISVSKEITKGEIHFFSASCWPPFSSLQALKLIKWCHAWFYLIWKQFITLLLVLLVQAISTLIHLWD